MIEVFKTNVQNKTQARQVVAMLKKVFSDANINFDLADCDKILRVDGIKKSHAHTVVTDLSRVGFKCEILH